MDKNQGYAILKAVMLENGRGFALGENPTAPSPGFLDFGTKCSEVGKAKGILVVPPGRRYNYHVGKNFQFSRRYQVMRIILKIVAAPFMLALTLIVAVLSFSVSVASWVAGILSLVFAVGGLFELFIQSHTPWGITWLVMAFLLSPFGLPAVAEWLICKLDGLNYSLKCFITD